MALICWTTGTFSLEYTLMEMAKSNPHGQSMDSFVFWAEKNTNKPIENDIFRRDLKDALIKTGLSQESVKAYTFHGWRHYFTAYMRDKVNEKLLQSQTGHKTLVMLDHYAGHKITGDRERIRTAQIETFGGLLPENATTFQAIHQSA
jgi:integrase